MSQRSDVSGELLDAAIALGNELRSVIEELVTNEVSRDDLAEATRLARELRLRLEGPRRTRWYDADSEDSGFSPEARRAYLEQSPIRGHLNPVAPPIEIETRRDDDGSPRVFGSARLSSAYEGPPHGVHGGWVAALFDEVLGSLQGAAGAPGVTAVLKVRYRHVTPVEEDLRFEAWIAERRHRRMIARATCHAGDTLTADAEGIFMRVDFGEVADRMKRRRGGP